MLYLHSERYRKDLDAGVRTDDPRLAIAWPLPVRCRSDRDAGLPTLEEFLTNVA